MNYENFKKGFDKPTIITAQQYGTKVSVELDHSDTDIDELFDVFETLVTGLGYHKDSWKRWILDRADEYREEDNTDITTPYTYEDFKRDEELVKLRGGYRATKEDEDEFDDYGQRNNKPHWNWDDNTSGEDWLNTNEEDLVWGTEEEVEWNWDEPNEQLKEAAEQHKKSMKAEPKKRKKKSVEDWENEIDLGGRE